MSLLWQQIGVGVVLALATLYLAVRIWRLIRGRTHAGGCGGCAKCPASAASANEAPPVVPIDLSFGERTPAGRS
ncbi:MAG: hypothetical protein DCC68_12920 [Planctomycetota bacterium]|nr:MAG: hypothetical protein DCC68_12920 [Planctomycetota bacterium]